MRHRFINKCALALSLTATITSNAQSTTPSAYDAHGTAKSADRTVSFDISEEGKSLPVDWGLDTAWPSDVNMIRGIRYMGADNISVARASFQPSMVVTDGTLPNALMANLTTRMDIIKLIGHPVSIVLNSDPGDGTNIPAMYRGNPKTWANLIDATAAAVENMGYEVVTVSPFNEPDYGWGQGSKEDFLEIAKLLKDSSKYPRFEDIRISGGNTLNCDEAHVWYDFLKDYLDEGNTHQLAGGFDHYADFFTKVRADGKHATADEMHNVMEAMVGAEYGMQTGIWWGTAELARAEFCKSSFGKRLAYSENRPAWTAASVYRDPDGNINGFVGTSERQARPSSFRFLSKERDVYFDGHGPLREYVVDLPGGNGYQQGQTNAEAMVRITWGEDVAPAIGGTYAIMNQATLKVIGVKNGSTSLASDVVQQTHSNTLLWQQWIVEQVPNDIVGDFSYYFITSKRNGHSLDVLDWSLDPTRIITYSHNKGANQQWYLEYDGDGYFHIRSKHSTLCLEVADGSTYDNAQIRQAEYADAPRQKWRFIPVDAPCETDAPSAPPSLKASAMASSVKLEWTASPESDVNGYVVLRSENGKEEYNTVGRDMPATSFIDNTVMPGNEYTYKILAVDRSLNRSKPSNTADATPTGEQTLLAQYTFDNTICDATTNGFNPNCHGQASFEPGKIGEKSLKFNGTQFLQLPYTLCHHNEFTVTAWVKWDGGAAWQRIFDFGNGEDEYMFLTPSNGSSMRMVMKNGADEQIMETATLPLSQWAHIAITVSDNEVCLYVDGQLKSSASTSEMDIRPSMFKPVLNYIGKSQYKADPLLNGSVDDFRIYNYPLSAEQIGQTMNGGTVGIDTITDRPSRKVVEVEYYNLQGIRLTKASEHGVTIERTIYSDGSSTVKKIR